MRAESGPLNTSTENPAPTSHDTSATPFQSPLEPSDVPDVQPVSDDPSSRHAARGVLFSTLEVSFIALQALDTVSTIHAVHNGLVEANPIMRSLTARPAAFVAVKAASTAGLVVLTRGLARRNPLAAIILIGAIDSAYSVVIARNFALIHAHRPR